MQTLCFATNNSHKLAEVRRLLHGTYRVVGLADIGCREELPETGDTLEANAEQKARHVWEHYQTDCFADDTGLEVVALGGAPGVYSARYAGPARDDGANVRKLLEALVEQPDRRGRFRTCVALVRGGDVRLFEGTVPGEILKAPRGTGGFGYDPVFQPEGNDRSFAEMSADEKNALSHRGRAVGALVAHLRAADARP